MRVPEPRSWRGEEGCNASLDFFSICYFFAERREGHPPPPRFPGLFEVEGGIAAKAALCVIVALLFSRGRREESLKTTPQVGKRRERRVRVDGGFCTRRSFAHWAAGGVRDKSMLHEFFPART